MANVGSAYVTLMPSMRGFATKVNKEFGSAGKSGGASFSKGFDVGGGSAKGFSGKMAGLAGAIGGVASTIADTALSSISSLGSEMIAASDSAQKFASTLEFAGLDSSTIDALTKSTQEYADRTVYDLTDIRNVTAQLASNGVKDYAQLAEAAGNLNAVAGGNADTFKSVGMVMTQTAGQGKLVTENWNQLVDAIPGVSGPLEQAMRDAGAFEGNFRDAMANGEISADEFFEAIQKLGMTDVAKEAATSTATIEGAAGNLRAAFVGVGASIIDAFKPLITGGMTALAQGISSLPGIASQIGEAFAPAGAAIERALVPVSNQVQGQLMPALQSLGDTVSGLSSYFQPLVAQLSTSFAPALAQVSSALVSLGTAVIPVIQAAIQTLAPIIAQIAQVIVSIVSQIMTLLAPAITNIATIIQTALPNIQMLFTTFGTAVMGIINAVFPFIQTVITAVMNVINAVITTVLALIQGNWSGVWTGIQSIASAIWGGIQAIISSAISAVSGVISSVLGGISGVWNGMWSSISGFFSSIWSGIQSAAQSGINGVLSIVSGIKNSILGFFSGAGSWLSSAGSAIVNGLADGIRGAIGAATSAISGVLDAVKSFLPHSPAKRGPFSGKGWTLYSGQSITTALAEGIAGKTRVATNAALGMVSSVQSALDGSSVAASSALATKSYTGSSQSDSEKGTQQIIAWLADNLPAIIEQYTPVMGESDFDRRARKAVKYA